MSEFFRPLPASPKITGFVEKHPSPSWKDCLRFLVDEYPQVVDGQVQYLVEGGVAVVLQAEGRENEPEDVDFILFDGIPRSEFQSSKYFGADPVDVFLSSRGITPTDEARKMVQDGHAEVEFEGRKVLVLSPALLAFSKTVSSRPGEPREKDVRDRELLKVTKETVEAIRKRLAGSTES